MRTLENLIPKTTFVAFGVLLAACTTDVYVEPDPTPPGGGGTTVTDGPSFSTITETNLTVNVDDEYNGAYMYGVEVYTENPLLVTDAEPIYGGLAKGNMPLALKMDLSQALERVYVLQKDPTQGKSVISLAVSSETANLSCDFKTQKVTPRSALRSALRSGEEVIVDTKDPFIVGLDEYTFKVGVGGSATYVIAKGDELTHKQIILDPNVTLRVEGSLLCDKVIVSKGGTLVNVGKVVVTDLTAEEGSFIENNCNISAGHFESKNGAQIKLGTSTIFKCNTINSTGTIYSLDNYAILRTTGKASFGKGENQINGIGSDRCLVDFNSMVEGTVEGGDKVATLTMAGNVDLLCVTIEYPNLNRPSSVHSVNKLASVNIPAGDCTGEGNEVERPAPDNVDMDVVPNGGMYTFAMEDNWPSLGDYDMNDLVLGIQSTLQMNTNQEVTRMDLRVYLRAVGATRKLGAGIQLDNVPSSNISRAFAGDLDGTYFKPGTNGVEEGVKAVLPFFDNAHQMIGSQGFAITNTTKQTLPVKEIVGEINFITPVPQSDLLISKMNFFVVNSGNATSRTEVHLAGYQPTAKVKGDASYWSSDGMMWGILVPGEFKYPKETVRITDAYPDFKSWSQSGRRENKDWYLNPVSGKVMEEEGI